MKVIEGLEGLKTMAGQTLGPSAPVHITQHLINEFGRVTGDEQWIHCDPDRAKQESPFGQTIAHGFLTLSLFLQLQNSIWTLEGVSRMINYGINKLRFLAPVPVDSQLYLTQFITSVDPIEGGVRMSTESAFHIEGLEKPVLIVESVGLYFA